MQVRVVWAGDQRFDGGRPGGPAARLDGRGETGQSPMDALLTALASCAAIDVVEILGKRKTPPATLALEVTGTRRDTPPRRYTHVVVRFVLEGGDIEAIHAERAIALSFEKYCSVSATLAPDTVIESVLVLNGVEGEPVAHRHGHEPTAVA